MRINRIRKNFISFKGRKEPIAHQVVKVYKNLHNGLWSIKDAKSGLVLGHTNEVTLYECMYFVGKGRERVIKEGRKNVHAYVIGKYVCDESVDGKFINNELNKRFETVTYNPYKENHFTTIESQRTKVLKGSTYCTMKASENMVLSY